MRITTIEAGQRLVRWMEAEGLTEQALARRLSTAEQPVSVSQSWISRIVTGEFRRFSGKAAQVLAHAGIRAEEEDARMADGKELIDAAVRDVWDGSDAGAKTVASLLRGAADLGKLSRRR